MRGFAMGAADIVPGVSGGTLAFVLGIYQELLESIRAMTNWQAIRLLLRLKIRAALELLPWRFLLALGSGIFAAILTLSHFLKWALEHHPALLWAFFAGLVVASILTVSKHIQRWSLATLLNAVAGAVLLYLGVGMTPVEPPHTAWFLFLSSFAAICAMILPGISGAFILVLLGKYHFVLSAVTDRDAASLLIIVAGAGVGIVSFAQVLSRLLKKYPDATAAFLMGMMIGSLRKLWPWKELPSDAIAGPGGAHLAQEINVLPAAWNLEVALVLLLAAAGFGLVMLIEMWAARQAQRAGRPAAPWRSE